MKRIGTSQRKTRQKYTQHYREKGKISLSTYFQELNPGESVALKINPQVQKGRFFRRFYGMIGQIKGRRGFCYQVQIKDGGKEKTLYVHPIHLRRVAT